MYEGKKRRARDVPRFFCDDMRPAILEDIDRFSDKPIIFESVSVTPKRPVRWHKSGSNSTAIHHASPRYEPFCVGFCFSRVNLRILFVCPFLRSRWAGVKTGLFGILEVVRSRVVGTSRVHRGHISFIFFVLLL